MIELPKTPESFKPVPSDLEPLPTDELMSDVRRGFVEGHIRRYMDPKESNDGVVRTEVDIPDGRCVVLHKNRQEGTMGVQVPRWNRVTVEDEDRQPIGVIELNVAEGSSPTNPSYEMSIGGRMIGERARGDNLDLALAELYYGKVVAQENGVGFVGSFGDTGSLHSLINAMHPGFSEGEISGYFRKPQPEDEPSVEKDSVPQQMSSRRKLGGFVSRVLHRRS